MSKFAAKAKKHIGLVKLTEMHTDDNYAFDILIKAAMTDDIELLKLTKSISEQMNIKVDLIIAVQSYINILIAKNADFSLIQESKMYLAKLAKLIYGIKVDGNSYRRAVDKLIFNIGIKERPFCINLAREFYPFCRSHDDPPDKTIIHNDVSRDTFINLWNSIEDILLSDYESQVLNKYIQYLEDNAVSESLTQSRQKIAKIITTELRSYDQSSINSYRNVINNIEPLFSSHDMRDLLINVAREFYGFFEK